MLVDRVSEYSLQDRHPIYIEEASVKYGESIGETSEKRRKSIGETTGKRRRNVRKLRDQGILIRHGSPKKGYWEIVKNNCVC